MRFLIDNALPPRLADLLTATGHDAVHVRTYKMHRASDEDILERALEEERIVVSADTDFGTLLALQDAALPSFILFRQPDLMAAEDYTSLLLRNLPTIEECLLRGCVAVFKSNKLRVRSLPYLA